MRNLSALFAAAALARVNRLPVRYLTARNARRLSRK